MGEVMMTPMQFKQRIYAARRKRIEQDFYAWQIKHLKTQLDNEIAIRQKLALDNARSGK